MVSATTITTATDNPKKIIGNKDIDIEKGDEEEEIKQEQDLDPYDSHRIRVFLSDSDPPTSIIPILIVMVMMLFIIVIYEIMVAAVIMRKMKV